MTAPSEATQPLAEQSPAVRLCGRCRVEAPWDPDDPPAGTASWWLCPPCRAALLGGIGRARQQ